MAPSMVDVGRLAALAASAEQLAQLVARLTPEQMQHRAAPDAWTVAEIAGHVDEMLAHWSDTARRIAADPNTHYGRGADDDERLAGVRGFAATMPPAIAAAIRASAARAGATLARLTPDDWLKPARHVNGSTGTLSDMVDGVLVSHVQGHVRQAREVAGMPPEG